MGIIISCQKHDDNNNSSYHYSKVNKSLYPMLFDKGSYWVFEEQNDNTLDSIEIIDLAIDTILIGPSGPGQGYTGEAQYYNLTYFSTIYGEYQEQLVGIVISRGCINGGYLYVSSFKIGDESNNVLPENKYAVFSENSDVALSENSDASFSENSDV